MTINTYPAGYWEVLLRLPGTNSSSTAARWFNRAFKARRISAYATPALNPGVSFARVRAETPRDLRLVIALVSQDGAVRDGAALDARYHRTA